ncbi:uncharacterized protein LOC125433500 [Sphaerodactylus townsendi]|uniref:uncharacterized protein LOC125433500 n=1 Tax=Sphaerodactylus townsendi TaxID=933632 RepID=UPI002025C188|nr:uncharacterized protein LOC125433500 [Sphaerodactylus townsendi]
MATRKTKTNGNGIAAIETRTPEKTNTDPKMEQLIDLITTFQKDTKEKLDKLDNDAQKRFNKLDKDTKDRFNKIDMELQDMKTEINQIKQMESSIGQIEETLKSNQDQLEVMNNKYEILQKQVEGYQNTIALMDLKQKEKMLRIRGLKEEKGEDLPLKLAPILAEIWEMEEKETYKEYDRLYRINSRYASNNKLPRDVIINCVRKSMRDEILHFHSKNKLRFEGQNLTVLKEVPSYILRKRKDYQFLVEVLRKNQIVFR